MNPKFCKVGTYKGRDYLFSHRNPQTNEVWSDDIFAKNDAGKFFPGAWVPGDSVEWKEQR